MRVVSDHRPDHLSDRSSLFLRETVADAIEGFYRLETGVHHPKLLAQPLDVAVDRPIVNIHVILIGGIHQLVTGFHEAGPLGERLKDHEFGYGQCNVKPRSEEHTSELQSLMRISYAVFCLKKKT